MRNLSNAIHSLANGMGRSGNFCLIPPSFGIKSVPLIRIKPTMNMAEGSKVTISLKHHIRVWIHTVVQIQERDREKGYSRNEGEIESRRIPVNGNHCFLTLPCPFYSFLPSTFSPLASNFLSLLALNFLSLLARLQGNEPENERQRLLYLHNINTPSSVFCLFASPFIISLLTYPFHILPSPDHRHHHT